MTLRPRTVTLTSGAILIVVLTALASWLPVPYVVLSPGPTTNTLGTDGRHGDVISISGHATYPTSGHLQLLTVSLTGGPGRRMDLVTALRAWFDPHRRRGADAGRVPRQPHAPAGREAQRRGHGALAERGHDRRPAPSSASPSSATSS